MTTETPEYRAGRGGFGGGRRFVFSGIRAYDSLLSCCGEAHQWARAHFIFGSA